MGLKAIQPWHYGFCDVSHAQSAAAIASGEKKAELLLWALECSFRDFLAEVQFCMFKI